MRRGTTVLLTAALLGTGAVTAPAGAGVPVEIVPRDLTITVTGLGPEGRTCQVDADLYVPAGVDADHRAAAVLTTNGFGGTKADQADIAQGLGEQGYVTLAYTGLGFVDGDLCPITLDDREHDGAAASQLLRFLGGDPSVRAVDDATGAPVVVDQVVRQDDATGTPFDPAAGMIGGSYGGQVQFATAAVEHAAGTDRLDVVVPLITWNDLAYALAPENGGATPTSVTSPGTGVPKYQWMALFTVLGVANGLQDLPAVTDPAQLADLATGNCANFDARVCTALREVATTGYPSAASIAFLRERSVASYVSDVRVPTLLAQGQADTLFDLQESVATYTALRDQGTPTALVWQSWGHSDLTPQPGELDMRHPEDSVQGRQVLAWFDHHLRGTGPAPELGFSYYRDWVHERTGDVAAAYAHADAYPVGTPQSLYLSGSGDLVPDPAAVVPGSASWSSVAPVGPNYTETSFLDQTAPVTDPPGTAVRFTSPPLTAPVDVVGSPQLTVTLDAPVVAGTQRLGPGGQLVLVAKLYDVGPDGAVELPHRLVSPVRVADVTRPVTVQLPGIVHRFEAGHSLAVVLAGGDLAYRGSTLPQPVGVRTGPGVAGELQLPVTG
ncbi:CocE/NonD family hydrolase [Klenkia brasiliensis]|uniref:Predicted acyl esterase n=1 Tax=Klenkia brasiliensis TaxID=333142 RepID=A0A1G7R8Q4_9ACTN|nr:CocE/NonD family hydrolase [Klenkia brasiliensis]SDG07152.1 Predicted acyl esterase [Klenkia brasiliensis]